MVARHVCSNGMPSYRMGTLEEREKFARPSSVALRFVCLLFIHAIIVVVVTKRKDHVGSAGNASQRCRARQNENGHAKVKGTHGMLQHSRGCYGSATLIVYMA